MPRLLRSALLCVFVVIASLDYSPAHSAVPNVITYTGELRGPTGDALASGTYQLTFSLYTTPTGGTPIWTEVQPNVEVTTGNFRVILGRSTAAALSGVAFDQPYYLGVKVGADAELTPRQQLVSLPYAFRARLADRMAPGSITNEMLSRQSVTDDKINTLSWSKLTGIPAAISALATPSTGPNGVPSSVWSLKGNRDSNPPNEFLGTTDAQPLYIKVNNETKIYIPLTGPVRFLSGLEIDGDLGVSGDTRLLRTLDVTGATTLRNTLGVTGATSLLSTLDVMGAATLRSTLGVTGATTLSSTLGVTGATTLGNTLGVTGATSLGSTLGVTGATTLGNTLGVAGATSLGSTLGVTGETSLGSALGVAGATTLGSTLGVTGATLLGNSLGVTGPTTLNGGATTNALTVTADNAGYLATIANTNGSAGDGLRIKLGRTHPRWDGSAYLNSPDLAAEPFDGPLNKVKSWIFDGATPVPTDIITLLPSAYVLGAMCRLGNKVLEPLNSALGLPKNIYFDIPSISCDPGCSDADDTAGNCDQCDIEFGFPKIELPCDGLPSISAPNLSFVDVDNSLTKENVFVSFDDKADRQIGAIRAQSVEDFERDVINANYLLNIASGIVGIDFVQGIMMAIAEFSNLTQDYNHIGVEYMSGNGDYAEWLERANPDERLTAGDIVAVRGGRITRELAGAEQIMAVSTSPIVLGNMPTAEREHAGNKVAFVGQIPVKVDGPVHTGDYVVARSTIPGYGVAVAPGDMTAEDFALCVGRSWATDERTGPKLANTVVGVQNGDFAKILKRVVDKSQTLEARMQLLEERVDRVTGPGAHTAGYKTAGTGR